MYDIEGLSKASSSGSAGAGLDAIGGIGAISSVGTSGLEFLTDSIDDKNKVLIQNLMEYRDDPVKIISKIQENNLYGNAVSGLVEGASKSGLAGIVTGLFSGILKGAEGQSSKEELTKIKNDWSTFWGGKSSENIAAAGYASGGKVKGAGTNKSDSIRMEVPAGAFIVPSENASQAMQYGIDYLGWNSSEQAKRSYADGGKVGIKVSNGEVFFTPDEYDALKYYGIDVEQLAPDAEKNKTGFHRGGKTRYQDGGPVDLINKEGPRSEEDIFKYIRDNDLQNQLSGVIDKYKTEKNSGVSYEEALADLNKAVDKASSLNNESMADESKSLSQDDTQSDPPPTVLDKFLESFGAIAGAAQTAGGIAGLKKAGARPDVNVSKTLQRLSRDTLKEAEYGLSPAAKNALERKNARDFRTSVNEITSRGGSAQELYSQIVGALSQKLAANENVTLADFSAREKKIDRAVGVGTALAGQEFEKEKIGLQSWQRDQDVWAELLSAGINNIVGSQEYNAEKKRLEEIEKSRQSNFTIKT